MMHNSAIKSDKFVFVITACISVPLILISTLISVVQYVSYNGFFLSLIYSYSRDNLAQISYNADYMLESANTIAEQIFFDATVNKLIYASEISDLERIGAINQFNNYVRAANFLESVYIYNPANNTVYYAVSNLGGGVQSVDGFYDEGILKYLSKNKYLDSSITARTTGRSSKYSTVGGKKVYTIALVDNRYNSSAPDCEIILNISADWLYRSIRSLDKSPQSTTFIIDSKGKVVTDNSAFQFESDISGKAFIRYILNSGSDSGYFIEDVNGLKSFITFASSDKTKWKYIRITPYAAILSNLNNTRMTSLFAYTGLILTGIISSVIVSKKLYKPYHSLSDKVLKLEKQNRNSFYYYKQNFLQSFLSNSDSFSENTILQKFKEFDIKLAENGPTTAILYRIDRYYDFCNKYSLEDRNLLKFGMANIASELCMDRFANEPVVTNSDHIVLIVSSDDAGALEETARTGIAAIDKALEISCSVVIGPSAPSLANLSELYKEILKASFYKMYKGLGCVIHVRETVSERNTGFTYPELKVKQFLDSIMLGRTNNAKKIFGEILDTFRDCESNTFVQAITRFAMEFGNAANVIEKNNGFSLEFSINAFISEFSRFETLEDISRVFMKAIDEIKNNVIKKKSRKSNEIVEEAIKIIHEEYWDANIALENISERVNVSSSYLRLLFKRFSNCSLSDYLTGVRMNKAKELLRSTSLPISEISERTGFINSSYFFTIFKKTNGITPNQYRQKEYAAKSAETTKKS